MSAVHSAEEESGKTSSTGSAAETVVIREGDWKAYLYYIRKKQDPQVLADRFGTSTAYKRACALAYLGRRAQLHGGVCSTAHPHIFTQGFIANLEAANKSQRFARYPWLEALMVIMADIERIQDETTQATNVIQMMGGRS